MLHEQVGNTNKQIEIIKRNETEIMELQNTITEIKTFQKGLTVELAKEEISEFKNRTMKKKKNTAIEITQSEEQKGRIKINEENQVKDTAKHINICIIKVPQRGG